MTATSCAWCGGSLAGLRRDAECCSVRCRQARHRFTRSVAAGSADPSSLERGADPSRAAGAARRVAPAAQVLADASRPDPAGPARLAYADPPYPGKAWLYRDHPDYAKPAVFAGWLFSLLAADPGDHLEDLFPGSGRITDAWAVFASGRVDGARALQEALL